MALIIISTGDFQIRWNVMSMSFSERESGKWPLALSDCYHNYLICNDFIQHSRRYLLATPIVPQLSKCLTFEAVWGVLNRSNDWNLNKNI